MATRTPLCWRPFATPFRINPRFWIDVQNPFGNYRSSARTLEASIFHSPWKSWQIFVPILDLVTTSEDAYSETVRQKRWDWHVDYFGLSPNPATVDQLTLAVTGNNATAGTTSFEGS